MEKEVKKQSLEDFLAENSAPGINLQSMLEDYREVAANLMTAHSLCCHFSNMDELTDKHQAAIQQLWHVIEAFIKAGRENTNVAE
ncbi:MAG: hypothetical protein ACOC2M_00770 [bacterium]